MGSAHGQIVVLGIPVPVPVPFCEVTLNACTGSSPGCSELKPGSQVQLCSSLSVPTATPDTDVDVTWKVLREERADDQCETTSDINALKNKGKTTMACLSIPARVQERKRAGRRCQEDDDDDGHDGGNDDEQEQDCYDDDNEKY